MARELHRFNVNIPLDMLARIDEYSEHMGIPRSAAILVLCNQALDSQKAVNDLSELLTLVKTQGGLNASENVVEKE